MKMLKTLRTVWQSILVLFETNSEVIISTGPGVAVPISILGKLFKKKIIFVESFSRVYNKSLSGKLIYPFADLFFVQWTELEKKYPNSIYGGRLT